MEPIIEWQSYEHTFTEHGKDWFWILGIITISLSVLAFVFQNYIFSILLLVCGITIGLMAWKKPRIVNIRVTPRGIIVGDMEYAFNNFHSFWIEEEHMHGTRLLLHPMSNVLPLTSIMIGGEVDPAELADILNDFLDEVPMKESLAHRAFDYIGF